MKLRTLIRFCLSQICGQYYHDCKAIISTKLTTYRTVQHRFVDAAFLMMTVRCLLVYYSWKWNDDTYLQYDILVQLISKQVSYDSRIALCFASMFYFVYYIDHFLHFCAGQKNEIFLSKAWEVLIDNTDDIWNNNRHLLRKFFRLRLVITNPVRYFVETYQLCRDIWFHQNEPYDGLTSPDNLVKFGRSLNWFPFTDRQTRVHQFCYSFGCEIILTVSILIGATIILLEKYLYLMLLYKYYGHLSLFRKTLFIVDLECLDFFCWHIYKAPIILVMMSFNYMNFMTANYRQANSFLKKTMIRFQSLPPSLGTQNLLQSKVKRFIRQHQLVMDFVLHGRDIFSTLFAVTVLTNIPLNAYSLAFIFYRPIKKQADLLIFVLILGSQLIAGCFALLPMAVNTRQAHRAERYFTGIQQRLISTSGSPTLKLKAMLRYEIVNNEEKIGFRAGPFGVVTFTSLCQFMMFYFGFLIFTAGLVNGS